MFASFRRRNLFRQRGPRGRPDALRRHRNVQGGQAGRDRHRGRQEEVKEAEERIMTLGEQWALEAKEST